jgi:hypothetical protein
MFAIFRKNPNKPNASINESLAVNNLPVEIISYIFEYATANSPSVVIRCERVCKKWHGILQKDNFQYLKVYNIVFGKDQWKKMLGIEVGKEPSLPQDILETLQAKDVYFPNQPRLNEFELVLIPDIVQEKSFTFGDFMDAIKKIKKRSLGLENSISPFLPQQQITTKSYWLLISKKCAENSAEIMHLKQLNLEKVPTLFEAAIYGAISYIRTGKNPYNNQFVVCKTPQEVSSKYYWTLGMAISAEQSSIEITTSHGMTNNRFGVVIAEKLK